MTISIIASQDHHQSCQLVTLKEILLVVGAYIKSFLQIWILSIKLLQLKSIPFQNSNQLKINITLIPNSSPPLQKILRMLPQFLNMISKDNQHNFRQLIQRLLATEQFIILMRSANPNNMRNLQSAKNRKFHSKKKLLTCFQWRNSLIPKSEGI